MAAVAELQHGATADTCDGRRDVRIGEPGDTILRFTSRLLLGHHPAYPCMASLVAEREFRHDRRGSPQDLQVYFAAVRDSLDMAAPGDCSSAIKPKVQHRPMFLQAIPFLVEPIGCWASTVARLQEARRHSQGLAELGYF